MENLFGEIFEDIKKSQEHLRNAQETMMHRMVKNAEAEGVNTYAEFTQWIGFDDEMTSKVWNEACQVEDMLTNKQ